MLVPELLASRKEAENPWPMASEPSMGPTEVRSVALTEELPERERTNGHVRNHDQHRGDNRQNAAGRMHLKSRLRFCYRVRLS